MYNFDFASLYRCSACVDVLFIEDNILVIIFRNCLSDSDSFFSFDFSLGISLELFVVFDVVDGLLNIMRLIIPAITRTHFSSSSSALVSNLYTTSSVFLSCNSLLSSLLFVLLLKFDVVANDDIPLLPLFLASRSTVASSSNPNTLNILRSLIGLPALVNTLYINLINLVGEDGLPEGNVDNTVPPLLLPLLAEEEEVP